MLFINIYYGYLIQLNTYTANIVTIATTFQFVHVNVIIYTHRYKNKYLEK